MTKQVNINHLQPAGTVIVGVCLGLGVVILGGGGFKGVDEGFTVTEDYHVATSDVVMEVTKRLLHCICFSSERCPFLFVRLE